MTLPLDAIRIVEITNGLGESCGRYLADLGAQVIKVEPPEGAESRDGEPVVDGLSVPFALRNANKLGVTLDLDDPADAKQLRSLVSTSDIVIESCSADTSSERQLPAEEFVEENPALVWVSVSPFGKTGPYRNWVATEQILYALSGALSRSGTPGNQPLAPPSGLVEETVGVHVAWSALLAYYHRLSTGYGQIVDLSALEVMVHGFDPAFGTQGSAAAGRSEEFPKDRPDAANFYPVFACKDSYVRICLLAKRQWRAMFEWLGNPEEFSDPKYDTIPARFAAAERLNPLIAELCAVYSRQELVEEGAARGVPIGGVLELSEVLTEDHFTESGALVDTEIAHRVTARVPSGYVSLNGDRAGFRKRAPALGEHNASLPERGTTPTVSAGEDERTQASRPFDGLRVLDLGVIVFGAELSRQFADYGADVIKIENSDFPDGLRQSKRGAALASSVAWGHRNKRSLGLNLRAEKGKEIFRQLAEEADVVLANFKPGTLDSMGLSYEELSTINPRIIVSESSAFGSRGAWRSRQGYGPLVRASCGVSALWRYPDNVEQLCDGATVYPDHVAAQVAAVAVLASLIHRSQTGTGGSIEVAQADVALVQLGTQLVSESLRPESGGTERNVEDHCAPAGIYTCKGDDEWCVVTVREQDWEPLCNVIGRPDLAADPRLQSTAQRVKHRAWLDEVLGDWTQRRSPSEATTVLQSAGVPAGAMTRLPDLLTDPQLQARRAYTTMEHSQLPQPLPAVARVAHFPALAEPPRAQAPLAGEQTREICREVLHMSNDDISALVDAGVLQPPGEAPTTSSPG